MLRFVAHGLVVALLIGQVASVAHLVLVPHALRQDGSAARHSHGDAGHGSHSGSLPLPSDADDDGCTVIAALLAPRAVPSPDVSLTLCFLLPELPGSTTAPGELPPPQQDLLLLAPSHSPPVLL